MNIRITKKNHKISPYNTLENQLFLGGLILLFFGGILTVLYFAVYIPFFSPPSCIWLEVFGIYCPGCGGTRAVEFFFQGHFLQALWYHPLVPYGIVVYGGFMATHTLERLHVPHVRGWHFHNWYLYLAVGILIMNFIIKNILKFKCNITL